MANKIKHSEIEDILMEVQGKLSRLSEYESNIVSVDFYKEDDSAQVHIVVQANLTDTEKRRALGFVLGDMAAEYKTQKQNICFHQCDPSNYAKYFGKNDLTLLRESK
ncbi:MAG: hypothetical protein KKF46_06670 [Nanoarchaeota archaeon]|nr:hypothetical protein [Nanoarchaeota archaeon]MBU1322013.1 hypothetical protein [Nanoarchaeota archaeon]MBU1598098.1 hypothetical protein [Nanoarchaeota archaeon]MBU2441773.1 hypothetical protein [Nanoarchaeota archaeon]